MSEDPAGPAQERPPRTSPESGFGTFAPDARLEAFSRELDPRIHEFLGAHPLEHEGASGTRFAVWAPQATDVAVVGDFNDWDVAANAMTRRASGVWEVFVPAVGPGALYKYSIASAGEPDRLEKADPVGHWPWG